MNNATAWEDTMIDVRDADEVIYRVSVAAFAHYPEKSNAEPGYTIDEDVDWAIEPVRALGPETLQPLRARVREAIEHAFTMDRQAFIHEVRSLATE